MWVIMKTNVFQFGVLYFLQLLGTAMGTSAVVMWARLYFAYHKNHYLLQKYASCNLLYFKRYINDIIAIWLGDTAAWSNLVANLKPTENLHSKNWTQNQSQCDWSLYHLHFMGHHVDCVPGRGVTL